MSLVRDCYVCKLTGKTMVPDSIKCLWEIKGDDMNIVIRLEKFGQNLKKIDDCRSGRSSWTKGELIVKKVRVVRVNALILFRDFGAI